MAATAHLMLGLPGSGKSTYATKLATRLGIPKFSLDEEYFKIVPNLQQEQRDFAMEAEVVKRIRENMAALFKRNQSLVLDFCPWLRVQRTELYDFLNSHGATPIVYFLDVPRDELIKRFTSRNAEKRSDTQYMTVQMLNEFYARFEPPTGDERFVSVDPKESAATA